MKYKGILPENFRQDIHDKVIVLTRDRNIIDKKEIPSDGYWEVNSDTEAAYIIYLLRSKCMGALIANASTPEDVGFANFFPVNFRIKGTEADHNHLVYLNPMHLSSLPDEYIVSLKLDIHGILNLNVWEFTVKQNVETFILQEGKYNISIPPPYSIHEKGIMNTTSPVKLFDGIRDLNTGKFHKATNHEVLIGINKETILELEFV